VQGHLYEVSPDIYFGPPVDTRFWDICCSVTKLTTMLRET